MGCTWTSLIANCTSTINNAFTLMHCLHPSTEDSPSALFWGCHAKCHVMPTFSAIFFSVLFLWHFSHIFSLFGASQVPIPNKIICWRCHATVTTPFQFSHKKSPFAGTAIRNLMVTLPKTEKSVHFKQTLKKQPLK